MIFNEVFELIILGVFGRSVRLQFGNKTFLWIYLLGVLSGGLAMNFLMQ
jgi:membrane associated rhomboid family serine protease